jgi:hypothetical protein
MTMSKKSERFNATRRDMIKYMMFVGAALGLPRWKVFEALELSGGKALAAAAVAPTCRLLQVSFGNGGLAYTQLMWPHVDIAAARNANFAWHAIAQEQNVAGTANPLTVGPQTPWKDLSPDKQVTCMVAGGNNTHNASAQDSVTVGTTGVFNACAQLQQATAAMVPVIQIGNSTAQNAPRTAAVANADGMVGLFNSVASRAGGALANTADAQLFETAYKGFLTLNAMAGRPTTTQSFAAGQGAANFLGNNLAALLTPSAADLTRYGVTASTPTAITNMAKALCTTAKAFAAGLSHMVTIPGIGDDPHGGWNDELNLVVKVETIRKSFDAFRADLMAAADPTSAGKKLWDKTVVTISGDTPKATRTRSGWPDGTDANTNHVFVYSGGRLKSGWAGMLNRRGGFTRWNPATGANDPASTVTSQSLGVAAAGAILFAVADRDLSLVRTFYNGEVGIGIPNVTG